MDSEFIVMITAVPEEDEARSLADRLIEERLAACIQMEQVESKYRWQGRVESDSEFRLMIKTRAVLFDRVEEAIRAEISEETPEIIALPVLEGSSDYLKWIASETQTPI